MPSRSQRRPRARAEPRPPRGRVAPGPAEPAAPWADAACLLAGALTPIAFHTLGTLGFEATKVSIIRLLGLILALGALARAIAQVVEREEAPKEAVRRWTERARNVSSGLRLVAAGAAGLVAANLLSTAASIAPATSVWGSYDRIQGLFTTLAWVVLGVAAAIAGRATERRRALVVGWALASVPVCLYGLAQSFRLDPVEWLNRPLGVTSTLGSSTALGGYLAMVVPLTIACAVTAVAPARADATSGARAPAAAARIVSRARIVHAGWVALIALQLAVLAAAQVRGAIVAVLAGVLVSVVGLAWQAGARKWALLGGGLAVAALSFATVPASPLGEAIGFGPRGDGGWDAGSGRQRFLIWQAGLEAVLAGGWRVAIGFGPETQASALEARFPAELANRFPDARFDRAHTLVVDQLLTTGLVGLAALVTVVVGVIRAGIRTLTAGRAQEGALAAGLLGALTANLVAASFAFDSITTGTLFWLVAGLLVAPRVRHAAADSDAAMSPAGRPARTDRQVRETLVPPVRLRATAALAAGALGLVALPWALGPLMADLYHTRALALRAGEAPASSIAVELASVDWAPWQDVYTLALADTYQEVSRLASDPDSGRPTTFEELTETTPRGRDGLFEAARLTLDRTAGLSPRDPYTHLHLARFWALWAEVARDPVERDERLTRAADAYERAIALSPNRATFHDELGLALTRLGRPEAAIERYSSAELLDGLSAERLARIGDAEALLGRPDLARSRYERALTLDERCAAAEHGLASLALAAGDPSAAVEHARRAARFDMHNWRYRRELALIHRALEQWPEALTEARAARRLAPAWEWDDLSALVEAVRR